MVAKDTFEIVLMKVDRLPLVDQMLEVAKMLPSGCDIQLELLSLMKDVFDKYAFPLAIKRNKECIDDLNKSE